MRNIIRKLLALTLMLVSSVQATEISGRILRLQDASPVSFAGVELYDAEDNLLESVVADVDGNYAFTGLENPPYFVRSRVNENLIDLWWAGEPVREGQPSQDAATEIFVPSTNLFFGLEEGSVIEGSVVDGTGQPVPNATVEIHKRFSRYVHEVRRTALTDSNGNYQVWGLEADSYYVRTRNTDNSILADKWYNDEPALVNGGHDSADAIALAAQTTFSNVNFNLAVGAVIRGTVTDNLGVALTNMSVKVYTIGNDLISEVFTDASGAYEFRGLPSSSLYVRSDAGSLDLSFADEWWNNKPAAFEAPQTDGATRIRLENTNLVEGVDLELARTYAISGQVTYRTLLGAVLPVPDAQIWLSEGLQGSINGFFGRTDSNGFYEITGLVSSTYYVATFAPVELNLLDEWAEDRVANFYNVPEADGATPYHTIAGDFSNVDIELNLAGFIGGQVTDPSGQPIAGVELFMSSFDGTRFLYAATDDNGMYGFGRLPPLPYYVVVESIPATYPTLVREFFDDRPYNYGNADEDGASAIQVQIGSIFGNINIQLDEGSELSGYVYDEMTNGLLDVNIEYYSESGEFLFDTLSEFDGQHRIFELPFGNYYLRTRSGTQPYADVWYGGALVDTGNPVLDAAQLVVFAQTNGLSGIDFVLGDGGVIAGHVFDAGLTPLENVRVEVINALGRIEAATYTGADGSYQVPGFSPGTFAVRTVADPPFANQWWNNVPAYTFLPHLDDPGQILFTSSNLAPVDATFFLELGGTLTGTVFDEHGTPLPGSAIELYGTNGTPRRTVISSMDGSWLMEHLPAGVYYVRTGHYDGRDFYDQWYDQVPASVAGAIVDGAAPIVLPVGGSISGIDFSVTSGARRVHFNYFAQPEPGWQFQWTGLPGYAYRLKSTNTLFAPRPWPDVSGGAALIAPTNGMLTTNAPVSQDGAAYYYAEVDARFSETAEPGTSSMGVFHLNAFEDVQWVFSTNNCFEGSSCWFGESLDSRSDMSLLTPPIGISNQTELSFWHMYDLQEGTHGGVVEISINGNPLLGGDVATLIRQNPYNSRLLENAGTPIDGRSAFTGSSDGYLRTVVDLSIFTNETIQVRFRLVGNGYTTNQGWWVDNILIR